MPDITDEVQGALKSTPLQAGVVTVFVAGRQRPFPHPVGKL
ncbi:MAG: hypothetical protein PHW87_12825 [Methanothrix sp.]|nr:hypothetical protein [Methanothrix sp.]